VLHYTLKRLAQSAFAIFGVLTLLFFVQRLTGDPTMLLVPEGATVEDIELIRRSLGFDRPLVVQYLDYLRQLGTFSLGNSIVQHVPIWDILLSRLPYTLKLTAGAMLLSIGLGLPIGVVMALARGRFVERILQGVVLTGQSMPTFFSGILLILLFAVRLGWLPSSGADSAQSLIMPSIALGMLSMATFARVARNAVLDELSKDYVRTARAKGVPYGRIVLKHLARNSAIPVITVAALEISHLLGGAVIVETMFAWPGLGQVAVQAINARDFPIVQSVVLLGSVATVVCNLLADLLYCVVDPRISLKGEDA
jgi:peptide/nickel transport system permease protein